MSRMCRQRAVCIVEGGLVRRRWGAYPLGAGAGWSSLGHSAVIVIVRLHRCRIPAVFSHYHPHLAPPRLAPPPCRLALPPSRSSLSRSFPHHTFPLPRRPFSFPRRRRVAPHRR